ncbi:MAG: MMPL family transporter, partial [Nocardioidaceae bacterium]
MSRTNPRSKRWVLPAALVVLWLVLAAFAGPFFGKLGEVQQNDNASFLPQSAESTAVLDTFVRFSGSENLPATVVFQRPSGLTPRDKAAIAGYAKEFAAVKHVDGTGIRPPTYSVNGAAAELIVPITATDGQVIIKTVNELRAILRSPPPGLTALVGGQGGVLADFINAFGGIDGILIVVALVVVLVILLAVYRSPVLPFVVLGSAMLGLTVAAMAIYYLAKNGVIDLNGQSQGIFAILAVGAATDYSLLIVSRYREELRDNQSKFDAMRRAYRAAFEPVVASGVTVILGLLCLLLSDLSSLRGLGPVGAIGIAAAMLSSLTLLPAVLLLLGRGAFWPLPPRFGSEHHDVRGVWGRVARLIGRRARPIWLVTLVVLAGFAGLLSTLNEKPVPQTDLFLNQVESVKAQDIIDKQFPTDTANPAIVVTPANKLPAVMRLAAAHPGVAPQGVSYLPAAPPSGPTPPKPKVVDGKAIVFVTLKHPADSAAANATVKSLRADLDKIGTNVKVGGNTAINLDTRTTVDSDRLKVIPAILLVIFVVLALLLRALAAPLLLLLANVLSFGATMGISALLFNHVFGFPSADPSTLLIGFVFLVALGIDYSIFLMTRVREESIRQGTHPGVLKGLSVTGGVITSAGVVLAATFAALSVLPLLFLVEIAFIVAFGVLLDTIVVRSLLVPALVYDLGPWTWWPSRLWHTPD